MKVKVEFRKLVNENVDYRDKVTKQKDTFEKKEIMVEDDSGDQIQLQVRDIDPFKSLVKGTMIEVQFKITDGRVRDCTLVSVDGKNGQLQPK
jgi:hypothetical protein